LSASTALCEARRQRDLLKEHVMRALKHGAVVVFGLAMASSALAGTAAPGASSAAPDGYATKAKSIGQKRVDIEAQENQRMSKCKAMNGDEKKGCEAYAKSVAQRALKKEASAGSDGNSKP
jgi:hypothetical protein